VGTKMKNEDRDGIDQTIRQYVIISMIEKDFQAAR
jgi:hypothetical protein